VVGLAGAVLGACGLVLGCGGADGRRADVGCSSSARAPKPDGRDRHLRGRIIWASDRAGGNLDLYVMAADGSGARALTRTPDNELTPAWSPDGSRVAFASLAGTDDAAPAWISVMNADGSGRRQLTPRERGIAAPTWSPDGTRIAFAGPGDEIYVMRADGSDRHALSGVPAAAAWPAWSPDGGSILVTAAGAGGERLWTIRPDGSAPKRLTDLQGEEGAWSPDAQRIAFASDRDGNPKSRNPVEWNEEIYVMARDGSGTRRITRIAGNDHWPPAWSPDGTRIAFTSDGCHANNAEILIAGAAGSHVVNVTQHAGNDMFPTWHR
jgi:TolB protein